MDGRPVTPIASGPAALGRSMATQPSKKLVPSTREIMGGERDLAQVRENFTPEHDSEERAVTASTDEIVLAWICRRYNKQPTFFTGEFRGLVS